MPLKFALIGSSGFAAEVCAPVLTESQHELVGVLGSTPEKSLRLAEPLGARGYTSLDELLADDSIEAIWLAADERFHTSMGTACLEAGKHLLVEKPIAQTVAEARTLIDAAAASGKILRVGFHSRFRPVYNDIHAAIHSGRLGRVGVAQLDFFVPIDSTNASLRAPWRARLDQSGGGWVVKEMAAHFFDLLLWWLGPAEGISGARLTTLKQPVETDDSATVLVPLASGATGVVVASAAMAEYTHTVRIHGTAGSLHASGVWRGGGQLSFSDGEQRTYEGSRFAPYIALLDDFEDAVEGRPSKSADGAAGLASLALSEQAIEWAGNHRVSTD